MVNIFEAFKYICLQQRSLESKMSTENFRKTLVQLIREATEGELENLAIDVENEKLG